MNKPVAAMSSDKTMSCHGGPGAVLELKLTMVGRLKAANTGATRRVRLWRPSSGRFLPSPSGSCALAFSVIRPSIAQLTRHSIYTQTFVHTAGWARAQMVVAASQLAASRRSGSLNVHRSTPRKGPLLPHRARRANTSQIVRQILTPTLMVAVWVGTNNAHSHRKQGQAS